ncbi:MAG: hypothetical protein HQL95_09085 [Magnetococcales bacterium]|nr:hypothetical protein [Magnetococcales bacterium]
MGLDPRQLLALVICPTLQRLDLWSSAAEELVLGIAVQESGLHYLTQLGGGPARGLWQMEKATHDDIWTNFLHGHTKLGLNILGPYPKPDHSRLAWDLVYACGMCRAHLLRCPDALPTAGDLKGQAAYWKKFYNTPLGSGTVEQYITNWNRVMGHI